MLEAFLSYSSFFWTFVAWWDDKRIVAFASITIAIFTALLWFVTNKTAKAARDTADVARLALESIESPRLDVVDNDVRIFPKEAHHTMYLGSGPPPEVDTFLFNTGRSTAVIHEICQELFFVVGGNPISKPSFTDKCNRRTGITVTTANTKTLAFTCRFHRGLSAEELKGIRSADIVALLLGEVVYEDILGWRHKYNFLLRYNPATADRTHFFSALGPGYNTHTKERMRKRANK